MANRFLVWMSAGVVAAGVSAAAVAGAGAAVADDGSPDGGGGTTTSDSSKSADDQGGPSTTPSDDPNKVDEESPAVEDDEAEKPAAGRHASNDHRKVRVERKQPRAHVNPSPKSTNTAETTKKATDEQDKQATTNGSQDQAEPAADVDTVTVAPSTEPASSQPSKPDVAETVATAVSTVITTLLHPFAANTTPQAPDAQPHLWTLAAAARREFEPGAVSPSLAEDVAPVENSLTYTPPPTFQDQIVLMIHETLSVIRKVTGVDVHALVGAVLSTGTPPFFFTLGLDTRHTVWTAEDGAQWRVWEFHPPNPTEKTVLAFHGGGNLYEPNLLHWIDYTSMARATGATVIVPLYPLATTEAGRATVVIPEAADFISHQIDLHGAENVSVYGDSAGSLIAISAVRQLLLANKPVPSSMVLVGMAAHYMSSNPDIRNIDDPLFDIDNVSAWDSHWLDGITDRRDPLITPLFFEPEVFKALPPTTLYVGTREILYPDTLLLHERAVEEGAPISVVVGTGLVHDWPISGSSLLGYSQTAAVRPDVYRQLGLTDDAATLA